MGWVHGYLRTYAGAHERRAGTERRTATSEVYGLRALPPALACPVLAWPGLAWLRACLLRYSAGAEEEEEREREGWAVRLRVCAALRCVV